MMRLKSLGHVLALCLIGVGLLTAGLLARAPQAASPEGDAPAPGFVGNTKPLWAGLTVNRPIFQEGDTADLQITFTLVNDGDRVIDPKVPSAKIVVNGKPLADSGFILGNGLRSKEFTALPPGHHLLFGYALGKYFERPGMYRVCLEGENFRSAEVVFRVLPKQAKREGHKEGEKNPPLRGRIDEVSRRVKERLPVEVKKGELIEGVVDRLIDIVPAGGQGLLLRSGVCVPVDDKTEYLMETGLDAAQGTLRDVLGKTVYISLASRGGRPVASTVVVVLLPRITPKPTPQIYPTAVSFNDVRVGTTAERRLIIRAERRFRVTSIRVEDRTLSVETVTSHSDTTHVLTVKFTPTRAGEINWRVEIGTDLVEGNSIKVPVTGRAVP